MTKGKTGSTRRKFITQSTIAGIGTVFGMGIKSSLYAGATKPVKRAGSKTNRILSVKPRYHRWHVDPGVEWIETNTGYATLDWKIPLSQTAIVLLDVWQRHYMKDTEARAEEIIQIQTLSVAGDLSKGRNDNNSCSGSAGCLAPSELG